MYVPPIYRLRGKIRNGAISLVKSIHRGGKRRPVIGRCGAEGPTTTARNQKHPPRIHYTTARTAQAEEKISSRWRYARRPSQRVGARRLAPKTGLKQHRAERSGVHDGRQQDLFVAIREVPATKASTVSVKVRVGRELMSSEIRNYRSF